MVFEFQLWVTFLETGAVGTAANVLNSEVGGTVKGNRTILKIWRFDRRINGVFSKIYKKKPPILIKSKRKVKKMC